MRVSEMAGVTSVSAAHLDVGGEGELGEVHARVVRRVLGHSPAEGDDLSDRDEGDARAAIDVEALGGRVVRVGRDALDVEACRAEEKGGEVLISKGRAGI